MFGKKKMSGTNAFIMNVGRANGNLVTGKSGGTFGNHSGSGKGKSGKETPDPYEPRTLKVGENNRFRGSDFKK